MATLMVPTVATAAEPDPVERVLAASPTDSQLAGLAPDALVKASVRCVPIEGMSYCLHYGWAAPEEALAAALNGGDASTGDMPVSAYVAQWASQPYTERVASEQAELDQAEAAAGKMLLMNHAILGTALPADFLFRFPEEKEAYTKLLAADTVETSAKGGIAPAFVTNCNDPTKNDCALTMDSSKFEKQNYGYYCGPTSLQGLVWNDPKSPSYQTQDYWASLLGTIQQGSTSISTLTSKINTYTHWDDSDYAGTYVTVGISSWQDSDYMYLFRNHLRVLRSPVQLHPKLIAGQTTTYYNVAAGYDFSTSDQYVIIFEPAGASGAYPPKVASEDVDHIRLAQYANSNQRDIAY